MRTKAKLDMGHRLAIFFHIQEGACLKKNFFQSHVQLAKFKISERNFATNSMHAHKV